MEFQLSFLTSGDVPSLLLSGIATTIRLFCGAWIPGFVVALGLVALRAVPFLPVTMLVSAFAAYHRNVPTVVQIMVWYFGMPAVLPEPIRLWVNHSDTEFLFALVALGLNVSAYMSEDIRSGLRAIPHTQIEAARSIGLGAFAALRYVMLPQAIRIGLPPLINRSLILFKDTSLAMTIGVAELTYQVKAIENLTFRSFEVFAASTLIYLAGSLSLMWIGAWFASHYPPPYRG